MLGHVRTCAKVGVLLALVECAIVAQAAPAKITGSNVVEIQKKTARNVQTNTDEAKKLTTEALGLYRAGKAKESLPLFLKALKIGREQQGEKHPETLKSLHRYATALSAAGRGPDGWETYEY